MYDKECGCGIQYADGTRYHCSIHRSDDVKDSNCYECEHHPECPQYDYNVELECICDSLSNPKDGANEHQ